MSALPDFAGKVAIVTGGAQGMGREYVRLLAEAGASVVIADVNAAGAEATIAEMGAGDRVAFVATDVGSVEACGACARAAVERFGGVDYLVNNAGLLSAAAHRSLIAVDLDTYHRVLGVMAHGMLYMARAVTPAMTARGGGAILNVSSIGAYQASGLYSLAKVFVNGLTVNLAHELAAANIRVNAVAPGTVATEGMEPLMSVAQMGEWGRAGGRPTDRVAHPSEIARVGLFLLSEARAMSAGRSSRWTTASRSGCDPLALTSLNRYLYGISRGECVVKPFIFSADSHVREPNSLFLDALPPLAQAACGARREGRGHDDHPHRHQGDLSSAARQEPRFRRHHPARHPRPERPAGRHGQGRDRRRDRLSSLGLWLYAIDDAEAELAQCEVYNDWNNTYFSGRLDRFVRCAVIPVRNLGNAQVELKRIAKLGFTAAMLPSITPAGIPKYNDPAWDPVFNLAGELGVVLVLHTGTGAETVIAERGRARRSSTTRSRCRTGSRRSCTWLRAGCSTAIPR